MANVALVELFDSHTAIIYKKAEYISVTENTTGAWHTHDKGLSDDILVIASILTDEKGVLFVTFSDVLTEYDPALYAIFGQEVYQTALAISSGVSNSPTLMPTYLTPSLHMSGHLNIQVDCNPFSLLLETIKMEGYAYSPRTANSADVDFSLRTVVSLVEKASTALDAHCAAICHDVSDSATLGMYLFILHSSLLGKGVEWIDEVNEMGEMQQHLVLGTILNWIAVYPSLPYRLVWLDMLCMGVADYLLDLVEVVVERATETDSPLLETTDQIAMMKNTALSLSTACKGPDYGSIASLSSIAHVLYRSDCISYEDSELLHSLDEVMMDIYADIYLGENE